MSDSEESPTPAKVAKLSSSITEISSEPDPSSVDVETQRALEDIDSCQSDIDALNEKASELILQVEMKYNKLRRPHFEKRNNLIQNIPNFWVTSFLNHPRMANIVEEEEEECLHYLKQVDVEEFEDIKSGFTIRFQFAPNPYFTDLELTKEFRRVQSVAGKPGSRSTPIRWKPNMDLTKSTHARNARRQRGEGRSFFSWFTDSIDPARDKIAEIIKDDLWPNPLQYYLASDIEVEENGVDSDDDNNVIEDDSVVIVGDDDDDESDDDEVYEVKDDEDDDLSEEELEETVESIEVEDDDDEDDDDDAIEVLGSDSEAELLQDASEISHDPNASEISHDPDASEISHDPDASDISHDPDASEISHDPDTSVTQSSILAGSADTSQDKNIGEAPDTSQTSELDKGDISQTDDSNVGQNKDVSDTDKVAENDDSVLEQENDDSVLDKDGNDSDLLKDDDDDDGE